MFPNVKIMGAKLKIAICGAGIGGLAAATLLAREGHSVKVFDQFDTPRPVGSGLMLQKTGLSVLGKLGLREKVDALGSPIHRLWGLTTPSLRPVLDVRFKKLDKALYGLGVQRGLVFNLLLDAAIEAGAELVKSAFITGANANAGTLAVSGAGETSRFDLVINGLGANSVLSPKEGKHLAYGAIWTTLPWPDDDVFDKHALEQRYRAARQMAGVMASGKLSADAPESLTYFWSIKADEEADWRDTPLSLWKEQAAAIWPETTRLLQHITSHDQLRFVRYRHRTLPTPIGGSRLVHIGDAWHATSPQLGQGANMALLDAWALSKALRSEPDISEVLIRFRTLRAGHIRLYQTMSWMFTPVYQGDSRWLPFVRDWLAAPVSRIWPAPQILAGMVAGIIGGPLKRLGLRE